MTTPTATLATSFANQKFTCDETIEGKKTFKIPLSPARKQTQDTLLSYKENTEPTLNRKRGLSYDPDKCILSPKKQCTNQRQRPELKSERVLFGLKK